MSVRSKAKGLGLLLLGAAGGALVQYFVDPIQGRTRRARTMDQAGAAMRDVAAEAERQADYRAGQVKGALHEMTDVGESPAPDDKTLKARVESEVLGREGIPKGDVVVNAENGVVQLRGQVESQELIRELQARTRAVDGVRGVQVFLHLPGEPEPVTARPIEASRSAQ
jgi:osmotically-inducible protein OsmY